MNIATLEIVLSSTIISDDSCVRDSGAPSRQRDLRSPSHGNSVLGSWRRTRRCCKCVLVVPDIPLRCRTCFRIWRHREDVFAPYVSRVDLLFRVAGAGQMGDLGARSCLRLQMGCTQSGLDQLAAARERSWVFACPIDDHPPASMLNSCNLRRASLGGAGPCRSRGCGRGGGPSLLFGYRSRPG